MKKFLALFIVLIFSILNTNAMVNNISTSSSTVWPYNTIWECNKVLNQNKSNTNSEYTKYERSKCYMNNSKYQYNICKK